MPRSLEDRLDEDFAPSWRPNPGEKLVGEITDLSSRDGNYGPYPIVTIETSSGERLAVHAFHSVLRKEIEELEPKVGDRIGVKYDGERQSQSGTTYEAYKVRLDRAERQPDWNAMERRAQSEVSSDPYGEEPF